MIVEREGESTKQVIISGLVTRRIEIHPARYL